VASRADQFDEPIWLWRSVVEVGHMTFVRAHRLFWLDQGQQWLGAWWFAKERCASCWTPHAEQ
jgi:hypothetical protein